MESSAKVPVLYQLLLSCAAWRIAQDAEITGGLIPAPNGGLTAVHTGVEVRAVFEQC